VIVVSELQGPILISVDEDEIASKLVQLVRHEGLTPLRSRGGREALEIVRAGDVQVVFADFNMPQMDGLELTRQALGFDSHLQVILIAGVGEVRRAVEAMRAGACDYLVKPLEDAEVARVLLRALGERRLKLQVRTLASHVRGVSLRETFGPSEAVAKMISSVEQVARSNFNVIILGETGSGKEIVARAIHNASSRANGPFVAVDCGAIPEALIESELFGHERGAFTGADRQRPGRFEAAKEGTLFLDEISNMPFASQAKLLRVLQEKCLFRLGSTKPIDVDARVLAASNCDLERHAQEGSFRSDLYFRLNEYTISLPPLRQRKEDVLYLAKHFLDLTNIELFKSVKGISRSATEALLLYDWPGNVRQLRAVIRRAVLVADNEDIVTESHLNLTSSWSNWGRRATDVTPSHPAAHEVPSNHHDGKSLREILQTCLAEVERKVIAETLRKTGGNKAKAARLLQIDYKTIHSKVRRYRIQVEGES